MHRSIASRPSSSFTTSKLIALGFLAALSLFTIYLLLVSGAPLTPPVAVVASSNKFVLNQQRNNQNRIPPTPEELEKERQEKARLFGKISSYFKRKFHSNEEEQKSCCSGHLVMVAGHGVFRGSDFTKNVHSDDSWALESFQRGQHLPESILSHISLGLKILANDPSATLIFSGGQSRKDCGARSEGGTYLDLVLQNFKKDGRSTATKRNIFKNPNDDYDVIHREDVASAKKGDDYFNDQEMSVLNEIVRNQSSLASFSSGRRLLSEEFARDSYENLVFSVCRFYQYHGVFPKKITVVGFPHKKDRFSVFHRAAMLWPGSKFKYAGIQAEAVTKLGPLHQPSDGKSLNNAKADPYLCAANKNTREERNPNRQTPPYALVVPLSVRELLVWCGPGYFTGALPWIDDEK